MFRMSLFLMNSAGRGPEVKCLGNALDSNTLLRKDAAMLDQSSDFEFSLVTIHRLCDLLPKVREEMQAVDS